MQPSFSLAMGIGLTGISHWSAVLKSIETAWVVLRNYLGFAFLAA
jgi:hypothetical protein